LVVSGRQELKMTVDRSRLQEILKAAVHPEIVLPQSLDGAPFSVKVPRALHAQFGSCPGPVTANKAIANQVIETAPTAGQYADCVRLTEGPSPVVDLPPTLDVQKLAEIGLEAAGMSEQQANQFFHAVDWKSTLTLSVPRQLRAYEEVKVAVLYGYFTCGEAFGEMHTIPAGVAARFATSGAAGHPPASCPSSDSRIEFARPQHGHAAAWLAF
jgi:hypothetical protein